MVQRPKMRILRGPTPEEEEADVIDLAAEGSLVTPGFHPLADFANFGRDEAAMLREAGTDLELFTKAMAARSRPTSRPASLGPVSPTPGSIRWPSRSGSRAAARARSTPTSPTSSAT